MTRAIAAATSIAKELNLPVDDATVLHNSNKLALRLVPADVFARIAPRGEALAEFEIELAQQLAAAGAPVAALDPRVQQPRGHTRDGFAITLWTYYEPVAPAVAPRDFAQALEQLHAGMRTVSVPGQRYTDRVAEALEIVTTPARSPELADDDRTFLSNRLNSLQAAIDTRAPAEQLLHGEPHPGNVLSTAQGPLFIDFETCCRGPIEFDLAHTPEAVCEHYPNLDKDLLDDCRGLVLAMVAAWRWDLADEFPHGHTFGTELLQVLREGTPWPTLSQITTRLGL
ncbi:aminoglycoside phosphotransferase [Kribbella hippodromi]|uniref:Aminoglycoside phosphotransferase n=1 Tax=Kribbella hippodromi TaxID=434347 RepID=A0ABN2EHZ9_9ACTN